MLGIRYVYVRLDNPPRRRPGRLGCTARPSWGRVVGCLKIIKLRMVSDQSFEQYVLDGGVKLTTWL